MAEDSTRQGHLVTLLVFKARYIVNIGKHLCWPCAVLFPFYGVYFFVCTLKNSKTERIFVKKKVLPGGVAEPEAEATGLSTVIDVWH